MQSLFCCSAATSSLCDLTTRRLKMRGVTFFKRLFGRPRFQSAGRISIKLSRLPKHDATVFAENIPFVTKGGQSVRQAPYSVDRSKARRLKKGLARPNPRRRSWSLLKKFNVKQNQHELTPPKTLKRHASMYSISSPLDFRHVTHFTAGHEMPLVSSPSTLELFEPGRQPVKKEIIPPIKKSTSLARISTYNPSTMTLCEAATISSQWLHQEELRASSEDLKLASKLETIAPDDSDRAPSRLGPLPSHETRPSTSRSRRTKASSRPSTAGSVSSTLFEVELGPPALKFEDIKITPPKRKPALSFSEARPPSRRGPVQEPHSLTTKSPSSSALPEAAVSTLEIEKGEARVPPPKRKPVPSVSVSDIVIPPSRTVLDQESRATGSPMAKRKPVPYHILDDINFSEIPSAWAQSQRKLIQ